MSSAIVIGIGRMGLRHIEALKLLNVHLAGVVDNSSKATSNFKKNNTHVPIYTNLEESLSRTNADLVIIATTAPSHSELTVAAARNGAKYILVEKPMATSIEECKRMIEVCRTSGTKLAINHQMRFMHQYQVVKDLQKEYELGELRVMTTIAGNMGLAMNAVHYFEAFHWLTDEHIAKILYTRDEVVLSNPRGDQFKDSAGFLTGVTISGKRVSIDIGADRGHGLVTVYGFRDAIIQIDELEGLGRLYCRNPDSRGLATHLYGSSGFTKVFDVAAAEVVHSTSKVIQSLLDGINFPDGFSGLNAVQAVVMAEQSANRGRFVNISDVNVTEEYKWA